MKASFGGLLITKSNSDMKLKFNIEYYTAPGEEIVLNILDDGARRERCPMTTADGSHWTCELALASITQKHIDYFYSVERAGKVVRHEWLLHPHRLDFTASRAVRVIAYDYWIDLPADSFLYCSAYTECVACRVIGVVPATTHAATVMLKVRAPQLRRGDRLALAGNGSVLGNWSPLQAVGMVEHCRNEWTAVLDASSLPGSRLEFKFVCKRRGNEEIIGWELAGNRYIDLPEMRRGDCVVYELTPAAFPIERWRAAGTVIPVFSLKTQGSFGVGDFGDLKAMVDWAASTGQSVIQLLPVNDTTSTHTWRDSYPYKSISVYALHPKYTDLRQLPHLTDPARRDFYAALQQELNALPEVDDERVNRAKCAYLRELYAQEGGKVLKSPAFKRFFKSNQSWLVPYAAFCHFRDLYGTSDFGQWPTHRSFDNAWRKSLSDGRTTAFSAAAFWYYVQFNLDGQLRAVHAHARKCCVILKGDIPIGVSPSSVETWAEPRYFNLTGQAGAPPDAFAAEGQNWGFPTYHWDTLLQDGCAWWVKRLTKMADYFDAYRIDHVLGFFRIWEIPADAVSGLLGQFSPALGMTPQEIEGYGLSFRDSFCKPYIADWTLDATFGDRAMEVREKYVRHMQGDRYEMRPAYNTQRKIAEALKGDLTESGKALRDGLMSLVTNVLFLPDHKEQGLYHPRVAVQYTLAYQALSDRERQALNRLYDDYYYRRNNDLWRRQAMLKLPRLIEATRMLACAEDLGMVPDCVPEVVGDLHILSLEIESMPKAASARFGMLANNPCCSVSTISTHDMPTLRQWWDEDLERAQAYYNEVLWKQGSAPHPMPGWLAEQVVANHLNCPSMLCLISWQDWMSIDEQARRRDHEAERVNVPANPCHYWRYRMHVSIEELQRNSTFNEKVARLVAQSGRKA